MSYRRIASALVVSLALVGMSAAPALAQLASSLWPMFQHDKRHSGRSTVNGPQGPNPQVEWIFQGRARFRSAPSIGADGTLYVGNGRTPLTAIDPDTGDEIWSTTEKGSDADHSQPAVDAQGRIYLGARDNDLWNVAPDGSVNCRYSVMADGDVTTPPTIAQDGTIFMGSGALHGGFFYAINPNCTVKWFNQLSGALKNSSPALNADESMVYVSLKTEAVGLNAVTGAEVWRTTIASKGMGSRSPNFSPVFANDYSAIYFNSKDGLFALNPLTGAVIWQFTPPHPLNKNQKETIEQSPAIGADGTIYFGASRGGKINHFYALNPNGTIKWAYEHTDRGQYENNQAVVGADGTIYVPHGNTLFAFAPNGTVKFQLALPGKFEAGASIGAPGVLYLGSGKLLLKIVDP